MKKTRERVQIVDSVLKLLHYLFSFTKQDLKVTITFMAQELCSDFIFRSPSKIIISPSLYTRIDNCYGAGNCCRVPFDLVFTEYDVEKIKNFRVEDYADKFDKDSLQYFAQSHSILLDNLEPLYVRVSTEGFTRIIKLYIFRQVETSLFSGTYSCPFLIIGEDRYFCGIHPFKPLHCWMPHMTIVYHASKNGGRGNLNIGRRQYGRNHKFGCPVKFQHVEKDEYFTSGQHSEDYGKFKWISNSLESIGFTEDMNFGVGLHDKFINILPVIKDKLYRKEIIPLVMWSRESVIFDQEDRC